VVGLGVGPTVDVGVAVAVGVTVGGGVGLPQKPGQSDGDGIAVGETLAVGVGVAVGLGVGGGVGLEHAGPNVRKTLSMRKLLVSVVGATYSNKMRCEPPSANALRSMVRKL
jgi:hypothetical protein